MKMKMKMVIESFITSLHCFDALQTSHKFNFVRAVTVKPINHKKILKNLNEIIVKKYRSTARK